MPPTGSMRDSLGTEMYSQTLASASHCSESDASSVPFSPVISRIYRAPESLDTVVETVSPPKKGEANLPNLAHGLRIYTFVPFLAHFIFTVGVTTSVLTYVDSRTFYVSSRSPTVIEPDDSTFHPGNFALLQSDITTALSFGATLTRVMGAWWSASIVWRCLFNLMEQGGLTLGAATRLLEGSLPIPWPSNVGRRRSLIIVYIVILATFVLEYSSPLIAGSITWNDSFLSRPIKFTPRYSYRDYDSYILFGGHTTLLNSAAKDAQVAWGDNRRTAPVMTRVLRDSSHFPLSNYPLNSTLQSVRLPYITIDAFELIRDPNSTITSEQKGLLNAINDFNPFFWGAGVHIVPGAVAFIPNGADFLSNTTMNNPQFLGIVTEINTTNCSHSTYTFGEIPQEAGFYFHLRYGSNLCFIFARVTYQAGAAECERCPTPLPNVVQNDTVLLFHPDELAFSALTLTPTLGARLAQDNDSIPHPFNNLQDYATEVLSRSYQIAWSTLANTLGEQVETNIVVPVPASRASIQQWRVYTWFGLNMIALLSGLCFVFMHRYYYKRPWLEHPKMACLLLDTRDVLQDDGWDGDPWDPRTKYPTGLLVLQRGGTRQRFATLKGVK